MAGEFIGSRALIYVAGVLAFMPALALVLAHNVWVADWRVLITLIGWFALITARSVSCFRRRSCGSAAAPSPIPAPF